MTPKAALWTTRLIVGTIVTVILIAVACLMGCAGLAQTWNAASGHAFQILLGVIVAIVLALAFGVPIVPAAATGAGASTATVLAQPPCPPTTVIQAQKGSTVNVRGSLGGSPWWLTPVFGVPLIFWLAVAAYILWIRRARLVDAWNSKSTSWMLAARHISHAFLGTPRPNP